MVFVSNRKQVVPLWRQRAGRDEEKVIENIEYLLAIDKIELLHCMAICTFNNYIIFIFQKSLCEVGNLGLPRDIGLQIR